MQRTLQQNRQLRACADKLKLDEGMLEELVHKFTNGRETSSKHMTINECQAMINHMNVVIKQSRPAATVWTPQAVPPEQDRMRKKVLSIYHDMGFQLNTGRLDMPRVNEYLLRVGYLHKPLNNYTMEELPKLITQHLEILKKEYAKR